MPHFDPVAALARLASLAAASPDDQRLKLSLRWACAEIAKLPADEVAA